MMRAMYTHGVRALLPRVLRVLQRSNWTGASMAMNDMGLPTVIHGILPTAYLASCTPSSQPSKGADSGPAQPPRTDAAAPIQGQDVDDEEDWGGGPAGTAPHHCVKLPTEEESKTSLWRQEQDSHIVSSRKWAESGRMATTWLWANSCMHQWTT